MSVSLASTVPVVNPGAPIPGNPIPPGLLLTPPQYAFRYAPTLPPTVCTPALFSPFSFSVFGGGQFQLPMPPHAPDPLVAFSKGLDLLGVQIAPLGPVVTQLKFAKAVANLIANMPSDMAALVAFNPSPLATDVAAVVSASSDLVALAILPLQLCQMVRGAIQLLINYFQALRSTIVNLLTRYTNVNAMIAAAQRLGNAAFLANATCNKERLDAKVNAMNNAIQAAGIVLAAIGIILCFITGGHLPAVPVLSPAGLVATVFDPLIALLQAILALLPNLTGINALNC